ncbi:phosphoribosyl-AMP cyclohydrolase [Hydrogenovibrio sp. SC-1]|uniref:phosphoribosyl-AMP cyclohydrolase n=1 Tax=Hydrogenovibrio sp. SC-1 TaxID=2065820 RepID=UPI000C7DAAEB|nr:phosphoribosyl-AMP cyclohydrolase [Hydrogenovibrio sp. SC-1]PLA73543.1 phosphoribosyl-AMP cyclohydrolase [Hydrogenovibrio sp. SC-1]
MSESLTFKQLEKAQQGDQFDWPQLLEKVRFDDQGLIPAIAQQHDTLDVLMMAWMDRQALLETLQTQRVCYWSRSRQAYWRKGEESGQIQQLKELRFDCDGDAILLLVDQTGPACHTGRKSCFYTAIHDTHADILSNPIISPEKLYQK